MSRSKLLGLLLIGTLVAAWFAPPLEDDGIQLSVRAKNAAVTQSVASPVSSVTGNPGVSRSRAANVDVLSIRRRDDGSGEDDGRLFASMRWTPPTSAALAADSSAQPADSPPQAPPLPFRVLGRYDEAGQVVVFLQHQEQNLAVRPGDSLLNDYKVESINGSTLTLRYLPLNQVQTLEVGGSQ